MTFFDSKRSLNDTTYDNESQLLSQSVTFNVIFSDINYINVINVIFSDINFINVINCQYKDS